MKLNGAPGEIRTPDLLIRSQSLYPAELRAHAIGCRPNHRQGIRVHAGAQFRRQATVAVSGTGAGGGIRGNSSAI